MHFFRASMQCPLAIITKPGKSRNPVFCCLGQNSSGCLPWSVVFKPGVATHLCVTKFSDVSPKLSEIIKSSHNKVFCQKRFAYCYHLVNLSVSLCTKVITFTGCGHQNENTFSGRSFLAILMVNTSVDHKFYADFKSVRGFVVASLLF